MVQAARANRSTGLFDNLIFLQALYKLAIQRNFFKMSYVKGAIEGMGCDTKHVVAQVVGSCDDALEISFRDCERRSFTNVPTFPLPMWTSPG